MSANNLPISEIFNRIKQYHLSLGYDYTDCTFEEKMRHFRDHALAFFMEVAEMTDSMPWKPWRDTDKQVKDIENLKRELIDCLFFVGAVMEITGIQSHELMDKFDTIMQHNYIRIKAGYNNTVGTGKMKGGDNNGYARFTK